MEDLVRYVWKHRLFPLTPLQTTDGQPIEVIHPGMESHNDGPDFFNAKIKISDTRRDCLRCRIGYEYLKKEYEIKE